MDGCCAPTRDGSGDERAVPVGPAATVSSTVGWVPLGPAEFVMGSDDPWAYPADGESPRPGAVGGYAVSPTAVTNAEFAAFVAATAYRTDAEQFGCSFVFGGLLPDDFPDTRGVAAAPWWREVEGANWSHPEGPQSTIADRGEQRRACATPRPTAHGPGCGCPPKPSGSSPPAAAAPPRSPGATSSSPADST